MYIQREVSFKLTCRVNRERQRETKKLKSSIVRFYNGHSQTDHPPTWLLLFVVVVVVVVVVATRRRCNFIEWQTLLKLNNDAVRHERNLTSSNLSRGVGRHQQLS